MPECIFEFADLLSARVFLSDVGLNIHVHR
jgi:hypothetical protein